MNGRVRPSQSSRAAARELGRTAPAHSTVTRTRSRLLRTYLRTRYMYERAAPAAHIIKLERYRED